jgi:hypothetical protein
MVHKITDINETDDIDETDRMVSNTTQEFAHTAMDNALKAQEINIELLRRTSHAWIEGLRYQARLSQGMAQVLFGQWGSAFASTTDMERPAQEQARSEVTQPATNGVRKDTEVAAEDAWQEDEKQRAEKIAKDAQKNTATATFPIEGYDEMNVGEISERLDGLSVDELKRVRKYEKDNKNRWSLRKEMKQRIKRTS